MLVAHADKSLRQLIKLQLACAGYDVVVAEDAIDAGRHAAREKPDVIVVDVDMPTIHGLEFATARDPAADDALIPVIFIGRRAQALERAVRLGAAACFTVPFDSADLLHAVARCASKAAARVGFRAPSLGRAA